MIVRVLGSAAGGGLPQWNCACTNCESARSGTLARRCEDAIAVSADGERWLLFNAGARIADQLTDAHVRPRPPRSTPFSALFLTDANVDHCAGILAFRQAATLNVYSTAAVRTALVQHNAMFAPFDSGLRDWRLIGEAAISIAGLTVRAIPVPGLPPSFAQAFEKRDLEQSPQAVAYEIAQSDGTTLLYAPIFGGVTTALLQAVRRSSAAFLDGSFWSDDELIAQSLGSRTARQMGHLPISGMGGSLELLRNRVPVQAFYTHVNNSNPVLESRSAERRALCDAGIAVAEDGMELDIQMGEHAARAEPSGV